MIRIILVCGLAIGSATGGAVALALAHEGMFGRMVTPLAREPLDAIALPAPAPVPAPVAVRAPAAPTALDGVISDTDQAKGTTLTLSTAGRVGAVSDDPAAGIDASAAMLDPFPQASQADPQVSGLTGRIDHQSQRSVDFSPLSTGVYR